MSQSVRGARRATFRRSRISSVDVDIVDEQRGRTRRMVSRITAAERQIDEWIHRPVEFRRSRLGPDLLSVEKENEVFGRYVDPVSVKVPNQHSVGH